MKLSSWAPRLGAVTASLAMAALLPSGLALAQPKPAPAPAQQGPTVKLIVAQNTVEAPEFGKFAFIDPGVYVATFGSKLEFDVQRASYAKAITDTEVIHVPGKGTVLRPLPRWTLDKWNGLAGFLRVTVKNSHGKTVASRVSPAFCPNNESQRTNPNSPPKTPFPFECSSDPFEKGMVIGLQRGWGSDPMQFNELRLKIPRGSYKVIVNVTSRWRHLLGISKFDGVARVHLKVTKPGPGCPFCFSKKLKPVAKPLPRLPAVPTIKSPPTADLPDLVPLPSWNVRLFNFRASKHAKVTTQLAFAATVSVLGNARLDVEGFRDHGAQQMQAFQYFFHNGRIVGRARVGSMGFADYNEWHFQQFAEYRLLNANKSPVVRSTKVGFCIAPTDPIDLLLPHALMQPSFTGLSGACGEPSALWVQEMLPLGWADTYFQFTPGQSFNITHLKNGTYFIEIIANPEKLLHETNTKNDISLRKVIIGGKPGHRTVRVPSVHGIDPER